MEGTMLGISFADATQLAAAVTIVLFAYKAGRMKERLAAISRHVTAELRRFGAELDRYAVTIQRHFESLDRRLRIIEQFLPHAELPAPGVAS
jgi:hypothetical protein